MRTIIELWFYNVFGPVGVCVYVCVCILMTVRWRTARVCGDSQPCKMFVFSTSTLSLHFLSSSRDHHCCLYRVAIHWPHTFIHCLACSTTVGFFSLSFLSVCLLLGCYIAPSLHYCVACFFIPIVAVYAPIANEKNPGCVILVVILNFNVLIFAVFETWFVNSLMPAGKEIAESVKKLNLRGFRSFTL